MLRIWFIYWVVVIERHKGMPIIGKNVISTYPLSFVIRVKNGTKAVAMPFVGQMWSLLTVRTASGNHRGVLGVAWFPVLFWYCAKELVLKVSNHKKSQLRKFNHTYWWGWMKYCYLSSWWVTEFRSSYTAKIRKLFLCRTLWSIIDSAIVSEWRYKV